MNPEAVEWLEALTNEDRGTWFRAPCGLMGSLYTLKDDHEGAYAGAPCQVCQVAAYYNRLEVLD